MPDNTTLVNLQQLKEHIDGVGTLDHHKADKIDLEPSLIILGDEITNVQAALDKLKDVAFPTIPEATENVKGIIKISGDLRNNNVDLGGVANQEDATIPRVRGIQGFPVANLPPEDGDVLTWDSEYGWWMPKSGSGGGYQYATPYQYGIVRLSDGFYPGDIGGSAGNLTIRGLQSYPLDLQNAENPVYPDQFLKWNGSNWINSYLPKASLSQYGVVKLGHDIGGSAGALELIAIQGTPIDVSCANDGDAIVYNYETNSWTCGTPGIGFTLSEDVAPGTSGGVKVVGLDKIPILHQDWHENYDILTYYNGYWQGMQIPNATASQFGNLKLRNDLGGSANNPVVLGLYDNPLDPNMSSPYHKQIMQYISFEGAGNGRWTAVSLNSAINFSGDLSGSVDSQLCVGWYGKELDESFSEAVAGDTPVYDGNKWILNNGSSLQYGNPEVKTFYNSNVRNTYKKYQLSVVSYGSSPGTFLSYSIPDNTSVIFTGKIIGRVINEDFVPPPEDVPVIYMPNPDSDVQNLSADKNLKFDLDDLQASTYYYNMEAAYERTDATGAGSIGVLRYVDSGDPQNYMLLVSTYPAVAPEIMQPTISLASPNNLVITSGYSDGRVINWTLYLEVYENGV